jgi:hypothetical protein
LSMQMQTGTDTDTGTGTRLRGYDTRGTATDGYGVRGASKRTEERRNGATRDSRLEQVGRCQGRVRRIQSSCVESLRPILDIDISDKTVARRPSSVVLVSSSGKGIVPGPKDIARVYAASAFSAVRCVGFGPWVWIWSLGS